MNEEMLERIENSKLVVESVLIWIFILRFQSLLSQADALCAVWYWKCLIVDLIEDNDAVAM